MENNTIAIFFDRAGALFFQTRNNEIPFNTNKLVQTGGNIQFGGFQEGLFKCTYQPGISLTEKNPPLNPTITVMAKDRTSLIGLFINIKLNHSHSS